MVEVKYSLCGTLLKTLKYNVLHSVFQPPDFTMNPFWRSLFLMWAIHTIRLNHHGNNGLFMHKATKSF
jgi:hypothetical protein